MLYFVLEKIAKKRQNFQNVIVFMYDLAIMLQKQERSMRANFQIEEWDVLNHYVDQISVWLQHELSVQDAMHALLQEAIILTNIRIKQMTWINKYG